MDRSGIDQSVLCSIATRPEQFFPILEWSKAIRSDRIIPFPSLHPADPQLLEHLQVIHDEGFKGVKMHPYYQLPEIQTLKLECFRGVAVIFWLSRSAHPTTTQLLPVCITPILHR